MIYIQGFLLILAIFQHVNAAPQFISFKEGKLGVNFGGYHAGIGLGGLLGGGAGGGLFAEAGTPHGQSARAGLGGEVNSDGVSSGGLYAGAAANSNVRASAGLSGGVNSVKSAGAGFASAQAGNHYADSSLGGTSDAAANSDFSITGSKSFSLHKGNAYGTSIQPEETHELKPEHKKVNSYYNVEARNEIKPIVPRFEAKSAVEVNVQNEPEVVVQEIAVPSPKPVITKEVIHYKPRRVHHHGHRKFAYISGHVGTDSDVQPSQFAHKSYQPAIEKRVDLETEKHFQSASAADVHNNNEGHGQVTYRKDISIQRNPTFFADIFNIPISTLKAVGNFLGNTAGSTSVSVQKTASVQSGAHF